MLGVTFRPSPICSSEVTKEEAMADAGVWVAWGIPARGRERQALDLLKQTTASTSNTWWWRGGSSASTPRS